MFLGQTSKTYHKKANLTEEGNGGSSSCCLPPVLATGPVNLVMTRVRNASSLKCHPIGERNELLHYVRAVLQKLPDGLDQVGGWGNQLQLSRVALNKVRTDFSVPLISSCFSKT